MTEAFSAGVESASCEAAEPRTSMATAASPLALASALALAACDSGGGSGGGGIISTAPTPTPSPTPAPIGQAQASRFLAQATMGATKLDIDDVVAKGYAAWLDAQFAMPRATTHWDWLVANGYSASANINSYNGYDNTVWRQLIVEPDQLRQRVGMALLDMLVVGIDGVNLNWRAFAMAAYIDTLLDNAFGNFRTLMEKITFNAAMASFLTFLNNRKANANGAVPDENYARELMQLFTLGLYQLNMDGSQKISGGKPIETYTQADVSQLARVFTGLALDSNDSSTPDRYRRPLVFNNSIRETGSSTFLGTTVSGADGATAVKTALDAIFAHSNLPPFVSKQLIQRLVTSNPTPAYVSRVAAVFADNGAGVRGDLKAVIRAILLDTEARSDAALTSTTSGKLREPIMRLTGWARAFGAASTNGLWPVGDTSSSSSRLSESPGRSQSVFNFFRPGYTPPNTGIANAGLVAPEFQLANELSVVAYVNYIQSVIANGIGGDIKPNYTDLVSLAADSQALVDRVNLVLASGQIGATTLASIKAAVDSTSTAANKVNIAILLTMAAPEYLVLK